ncbi:MAG: methyltransferase [Bacteroidetes bacterium]|nr:methyltransferase [Bacteroidota bacterium]
MKAKRQAKVFHFKKFSVNHDRCAMKVGTDSVLLGTWVNVDHARRILDIGTGSGVIALMLAQRTNEDALIDAIEIEKNDAEQATENVLQSPWPVKISVHQTSLQEFHPDHRYDLIVSNPPYFINSLLPPSQERTKARHASDLTFEELISHSLRLLKSDGRLAVVLPFAEGNIFKSIAIEKQLHLIRETAFHSREEKPMERWLFEFSCIHVKHQSSRLVLYDNIFEQSKEYINLTKDFYL